MKTKIVLSKIVSYILCLAMIMSSIIIPDITVYAQNEETISYTALDGVNSSGSETYGNLFDGKTTTKWCVTISSNPYVIFKTSSPVYVSGYSITTANDTAGSNRNPKTWTLSACNDYDTVSKEGSWKEIHSITDDTELQNANYATTEYLFDSETQENYQYFKLVITANCGSSHMQMSKFTLNAVTCKHEFTELGTYPPTCNENGYILKECSLCGLQKKFDNGVPATGHSFNNKVCTICGAADNTPVKPAGEGTIESPYMISSAGELLFFAGIVNGDTSICTDGVEQNKSAYAKLISDITLNENVLNEDGSLSEDTDSFISWTPIGTSSALYTGMFDGNGHIISGLYFNDDTTSYVGLFGYTDSGFVCQNVGITDSYFYGKTHVGGICGSNKGTIKNCFNTATVKGNDTVGGICGTGNSHSIISCYNAGQINANNYRAGIVGSSSAGTFTDCYNNSDICSYGLFHYNYSSTITNCENKGNAFFTSGEAAYLLNGSQSENVIWYQNIDNDAEKDSYPVLDNTHGIVKTHGKAFTNTDNTNHVFDENGICSICGYDYYNDLVISDPVLESQEGQSITLAIPDDGLIYEYKCNNGSWQDSPVFTDLSYYSHYDFCQRVKASAALPASSQSGVLTIAIDHGVSFTALDGTSGVMNQGYDYLIDGKYTDGNATKWFTGTPPIYAVFKASRKIPITGYFITTGNDSASYSGRNPKSWILYGCNDYDEDEKTGSWEEIHSVTDDTILENKNYTTYEYKLPSSAHAYQYYKLYVSANQGASNTQIGELTLRFIASEDICMHENTSFVINAQDSDKHDKMCDSCSETLASSVHDFTLQDTEQVCSKCGIIKGSITNNDYQTSVNEDEIAAPVQDNFTVNSNASLTFTWYEGDVTSEIDADILTNARLSNIPSAQGTYTLIAQAPAVLDTVSYTQAELRLLIEVTAPPTLSGSVTINGNLQYGETLTAVPDIAELDSSLLKYQWYHINEAEKENISGATTEFYTLTADDIGKVIGVSVTSDDISGSVDATTTSAIAKLTGTVTITSTTESLSKEWDGLTPSLPEFTSTNALGENNCNVTYEYENVKNIVAGFRPIAPTDAGAYYVRVRVAEDDTHKEAVSDQLLLTIRKAPAVINVLPVAETNLVYNKTYQQLLNITNASVTGGAFEYSLSKTSNYSSSVPKKAEVGTYSVWVKVVGDANHSDIDPEEITVIIDKAPTSIAFNGYDPSKEYDGQALLNPTADELIISDGISYSNISYDWYKVNGDKLQYLASAPKDVGTYVVIANYNGTSNYKSSTAKSDQITITQQTPSYTIPQGLTATCGDMLSNMQLPDGFEWTDEDCILYAGSNEEGQDVIKSARFVPEDTNSETVENISISIAVSHDLKTISNGNDTHSLKCSKCSYSGQEEACSGGTATCSQKATCNTCNTVYGETDPDNHKFTTYTAKNDATCNTNGHTEAVCDYGCSAKDIKEIPNSSLGHDYEVDHFEWADDGSSCNIFLSCKREGCQESNEEHTVQFPCTITSFVKSQATCKEMGTTTYKAVYDKYQDTKDIQDIPYTDHTPSQPVKENEHISTCDQDGSYEEVTYCSVCDKELSRQLKTITKTDHDLKEVPQVNATCSQTGVKAHYICQNCNQKFVSADALDPITDETDLVIAKNPLSHSNQTYIKDEKAATCTQEGYTGDIYCSDCDTKIAQGEITSKNPENHTGETETANAKNATCKEEGYSGDLICSGCKVVLKNGSVTPKSDIHTYTNGVCSVCDKIWEETINGITYQTITDEVGGKPVGKLVTVSGNDVPQVAVAVTGTGDDFAQKNPDGKVTVPSGITGSGSEQTFVVTKISDNTFSNVSVTELVIPDTVTEVGVGAFGNITTITFNGITAPAGIKEALSENVTANVPDGAGESFKAALGNKANIIEMHSHTYADTWTYDGTYHWHTATCEHTEETADKAEHTFGEWTVIKEATEDAEGVKERSCSCGYKETAKIDKITHTVHISDDGQTTLPTCEEKGMTIYKCKKCGKVMEITEIPAYGHTIITDKAVWPTCTTAGKSEGSHCAVCEKVIKPQLILNATGHIWDDGYNNGEGDMIYTCQNCNAQKTKEVLLQDDLEDESDEDEIEEESESDLEGDIIDDKNTGYYEISDFTKKEVIYKTPISAKSKTITIPSTIKIDGKTYKVTKIADNAFKGNKIVTKITISSNIKSIGKEAFNGCKKLKTITIKSTKLTSKTLANNAFKGLTKNTTIKVPKKKLSAYKKLFKKKGLSSKVKIKTY